MLTKEMKNSLVDKIILELDPAFILLFGSFAKGTIHAESDIDLAYFSDKQLSSYERFIFAAELAELAMREVDLVDIKQIDTVFTMQIFEQGIPIYIQDENELTRQIMRACEASIDLAMHIVNGRRLGVPKTSREAFQLLQEAKIIEAGLAKSLMNMVGFRNIAVQDYQALDIDVLEGILEKHIDDFKDYTKVILQLER